jgi:hypothetical protein
VTTFDLLTPAQRGVSLPAHEQAAIDARIAQRDSESRIERQARRRSSACKGENFDQLMRESITR